MNLGASVFCTHCSGTITEPHKRVGNFLRGTSDGCEICREEIDWPATLQKAIETNFLGNGAFACIGAESTIIRLRLEPEQTVRLRFVEYNIPENAKILYVNYSPQAKGVVPLEVHGSTPLRRIIGNEVLLYARPFGATPGPADVAILVTWVPHTGDDESWENLVRAFEAYAAHDLAGMIIPANVAVECRLARLLTDYLVPLVGRKHTDDFLQTAATYSYQLNVLAPLVLQGKSLPVLDTAIRGNLNQLRGLRNSLAHRGSSKKPIENANAASLLSAAVLGVHYVDLMRTELIPQKS